LLLLLKQCGDAGVTRGRRASTDDKSLDAPLGQMRAGALATAAILSRASVFASRADARSHSDVAEHVGVNGDMVYRRCGRSSDSKPANGASFRANHPAISYVQKRLV